MRRLARIMTALIAIGAGTAFTMAPTPASAAGEATAPPGYVRVFTDPIPIPPSQFDFGGQVLCPTGTVPWGGGTTFTGGIAGEGENINSSNPLTTGWEGRFNNSGTQANDHFAVEAICAEQPPGYTMTFATADNPAGSKSAAVAVCPAGTRVLSGGTLSTGDTVDLELLSAWPLSVHKFKSVMWNGSGRDEKVTSFAVCAQRPPRYTITSSTFTDMGGPVTDVGGAQCPAGTSIIGGGIHVAAARPTVTLGSSVGEPDMQWLAEVINTDPAPATVTLYAICAA